MEGQKVKGRRQGDLAAGDPHHRTVAHGVDAEEERREKGEALATDQGGDDQVEQEAVHTVQEKGGGVGRVGTREEPEVYKVEEVGQGLEEVADREGEDVAQIRGGTARLDPPNEVVGVVTDPEGARVDSEGQRHQQEEKERLPLLKPPPPAKQCGGGPLRPAGKEENPQGQKAESDEEGRGIPAEEGAVAGQGEAVGGSRPHQAGESPGEEKEGAHSPEEDQKQEEGLPQSLNGSCSHRLLLS